MAEPFPLALPPGLMSEDTTFATPGRWADADNVRFDPVTGKPKCLGMTRQYTVTWSPSITSADNSLYGAGLAGGVTYYIATNAKVWEWTLSAGGVDANPPVITWTAVTPSPAPSSGTVWCFGGFGTRGLALAILGKLYVSGVGGGTLTAVATAPTISKWMLVTPERQVLLFGTQEEASGTYNQFCIRGSDLEDYTAWTTSSTNNAFEHILESRPGTITTARMVGTYVAVLVSNGLWMGQFLGEPGQTYRFEEVATGCGTSFPYGAVARLGQLYWCDSNLNFWHWIPGSLPERIPCPILEEFRDNYDSTAGSLGVWAETCNRNDEIWWWWVDSRLGTRKNNAMVYCYRTGVWTTCTVRSGGFETHLDYGNHMMGFAYNANGLQLYRADYKHNANDTYPTWSLTSTDLYLDEGTREVMVQSIRPDFDERNEGSGGGSVAVTLNMRRFPGSTTVTTKGPYTLASGAGKKDFRASGKLVAVTFSGTNSAVRFGKPAFDVVVTGRR